MSAACTICGDPVGECWHDTAPKGRTLPDDYFGQVPRWLRRSGLSAGSKLVFAELSEHHMTHHGAPFVGAGNLADCLSVKPDTATSWADELAAAGVVDIYEEGHSGTHYRIAHWPAKGIHNPAVNLPPGKQRKKRKRAPEKVRDANYYKRKFGTDEDDKFSTATRKTGGSTEDGTSEGTADSDVDADAVDNSTATRETGDPSPEKRVHATRKTGGSRGGSLSLTKRSVSSVGLPRARLSPDDGFDPAAMCAEPDDGAALDEIPDGIVEPGHLADERRAALEDLAAADPVCAEPDHDAEGHPWDDHLGMEVVDL